MNLFEPNTRMIETIQIHISKLASFLFLVSLQVVTSKVHTLITSFYQQPLVTSTGQTLILLRTTSALFLLSSSNTRLSNSLAPL